MCHLNTSFLKWLQVLIEGLRSSEAHTWHNVLQQGDPITTPDVFALGSHHLLHARAFHRGHKASKFPFMLHWSCSMIPKMIRAYTNEHEQNAEKKCNLLFSLKLPGANVQIRWLCDVSLVIWKRCTNQTATGIFACQDAGCVSSVIGRNNSLIKKPS